MRLSSAAPQAGQMLKAIEALDLPELHIMEVCGTHTMAIAKVRPAPAAAAQIHLISGPGCPVCVTPGVMDEILRLSENPNVILTTYGDLRGCRAAFRETISSAGRPWGPTCAWYTPPWTAWTSRRRNRTGKWFPGGGL